MSESKTQTMADQCRQLATFLDDHSALRVEVNHYSHPRVFLRVEDFRALFRGAVAKCHHQPGYTHYEVERDGLVFKSCEAIVGGEVSEVTL